ncbi:MAG: RnfABCDGE type electron transport complex subunit G [Ruminococcaceae bacterium]|nr:RnfABCDGE type electron transport complex subunit G [Oscillospiraceae bacterium]
MENKDIKIIVKTALSLFLICAVATGILAFINSVTDPMIAENNKKAADEARLSVLPSAAEFAENTAENGKTYYIGSANGELSGYVFTTSAAGYGGQIEVMTGIGADGTVTGISILTINETPGLGMNAKKDSFVSQYAGKSGPFDVIKNTSAAENDIVAITSATITSKAVTNAVNEALALYETVKEG